MLSTEWDLADLFDDDDVQDVLTNLKDKSVDKELVNEVAELVIKRLSDKLGEGEVVLGRCECTATITPDTVREERCRTCTRPVTLTIGRSDSERI